MKVVTAVVLSVFLTIGLVAVAGAQGAGGDSAPQAGAQDSRSGRPDVNTNVQIQGRTGAPESGGSPGATTERPGPDVKIDDRDTTVQGRTEAPGQGGDEGSALPRSEPAGTRIFGLTPTAAALIAAAILVVVILAIVSMTRADRSRVDIDRR